MAERSRRILGVEKTDVEKFVNEYMRAIGELLRDYYREDSQLTFQGQSFIGSENILMFRNFSYRKSRITSIDSQPLSPSNEMFVSVTGDLQFNDKDDDVHLFSQTLHLKPTPEGSFYVFNDILRLHRKLDPLVSSSGVEDQTLPSPLSN